MAEWLVPVKVWIAADTFEDARQAVHRVLFESQRAFSFAVGDPRQPKDGGSR